MEKYEVKDSSHDLQVQKKRGVTHGYSLFKVFCLEAPEKGQSTTVGDGTVIDLTRCAMSPQSDMICGLCHTTQGAPPSNSCFDCAKRKMFF